jgi:cytochrome o ubiquinol oxidase subunit II
LRTLLLLPLFFALAGCKTVVLSPSGEIAAQQRDLLVQSTALMLLIIVPVMALTAWFAWHYRHGNKAARYEPDWDHSTQLELVIWGAPLLIIICLGALTWMGTHLLDPYRPLTPAAASERTPTYRSDRSPLEVQVVALDWKWLFLYPEYGIATVNELAAPVDRPIAFRITSSAVMNSLYIPALAGQIYAMPGMETKLHAVINKAGTYEGFSANYSGAGFSGMRFAFRALDEAGFDKWVANVRAVGGSLGRERYLELERPSENEPVRTFGTVDNTLYKAILNMCVQPGKMCMDEMAAIDARGGLGIAGAFNTFSLDYDKHFRRGTVFGAKPDAVATLCAIPPADDRPLPPSLSLPLQVNTRPVLGAGMPRPVFSPMTPATPRGTGADKS